MYDGESGDWRAENIPAQNVDLNLFSINDLGDVNVDSTIPDDGYVLRYDATSGDWRAAPNTILGVALGDIVGIDLVPTPIDGDFLRYDASFDVWRPDTLIIPAPTLSITDLTDVSSAPGPEQGAILKYNDNLGLYVPSVLTIQDLVPTGSDLSATIVGVDSSIIVDVFNNRIFVNEITINSNAFISGDVLVGGQVDATNFQGTTANVDTLNTFTINSNEIAAGNITAELKGSVIADDSSVLVDGRNALIVGNVDNLDVQTQNLSISTNGASPISVFATTAGNNGPNLSYNAVRNTLDAPAALVAGDTIIDFAASGFDGTTDETPAAVIKMGVDSGATVSNGIIPGRVLFLTYNASGATGTNNAMVFNSQGNLGIKTGTPAEALDVRGNGVFSGDVTAAAFKGSLMADDSSTIIDAIEGNITAPGYVTFGSYTAAARPAGINGMVIYNSDANRFQGFQNGGWINLDDGSAA